MSKNTFVMLAKNWCPSIDTSNWLLSEKFNGMRALWCGIPGKWHGLWSRQMKPIYAPEWWTAKHCVEGIMLDGELFAGSFKRTIEICRSHNSPCWGEVDYKVFDRPFYRMFCGEEGETVRFFNHPDVQKYLTIEQLVVPEGRSRSTEFVRTEMDKVIKRGGEGVMLRRPDSYWCPVRSDWLLKCKRVDDSIARVIGHTPGKGKYEGMVGALIVEDNGCVFKLSGMTDEQRSVKIPNGTLIRYEFRGLTSGGKPCNASFREIV